MKVATFTALIFAALLAACGDEQTAENETTLGDSIPALPHEPAAGMDRPPGGMGTALMRDLAGGGVGGDVSIHDRGGETEIRVTLTGAQPNAEHPGDIHSGSCSAIGGVLQPLEPISTDSTGTGTMTAEVGPTQVDLTNQRIIVYRTPGGQPIACAEVPPPTSSDDPPTI